MNRAKQAEKDLSEKMAKLSGLKRQVSQMVAAVFGKSSRRLSSSFRMCISHNFIFVGGLSDSVKQVPEVPTSTRAW